MFLSIQQLVHMYNWCKYICINNTIIPLYTPFTLYYRVKFYFSNSVMVSKNAKILIPYETYERTCSSFRNDDRHWESFRISFPLVVRTRTSTQSTRCLWARSKCHEYRQVFSEGEPVIGNEWVFRVTFFFYRGPLWPRLGSSICSLNVTRCFFFPR